MGKSHKHDYLTAIIYTARREKGTSGQFLKYRNIKNNAHTKAKFINDMKKRFQSMEHVNFYYQDNNEFHEQITVI